MCLARVLPRVFVYRCCLTVLPSLFLSMLMKASRVKKQ